MVLLAVRVIAFYSAAVTVLARDEVVPHPGMVELHSVGRVVQEAAVYVWAKRLVHVSFH